MRPTVDAVASEHRETFIIAKLDIDENPDTTKEYGGPAHPIYIIFRDGEVVGKFVGAMPQGEFVQKIFDILK